MKVSVLGAGAMGSALTVPLADNDHEVLLWGSEYDESILTALRRGEDHPRLGVQLPDQVELLDPEGLGTAVSRADLLVLGVSSGGVVPVTRRIAPFLEEEVPLVSIAKGLVEYRDQPWFIHEGIRRVLEDEGVEGDPVVVGVGGPSIAAELAGRSRTAVTYASFDETALDRIASAFRTDYYNVKTTTDLNGLAVCVGYKNAYSISLAWPDGLTERGRKDAPGNMTNLKAILFLRTMDELEKLAGMVDGEQKTVRGLAGLGDLVTTSSAGRNGKFGRLLGSGLSVKEALEELERQGVGVIEGYETADAGWDLAQSLMENQDTLHERFPLLREINLVLYGDKPVEEAVDRIRL